MSDAASYAAAAAALEEYASVRATCDRRLSSVLQTPDWTSLVKVECFERPKTWRLVHENSNGEKEEIVFVVQGSIVDKNLPPVTERPKMNADKYKYLRQSVSIAGLGTTTFNNAMKAAVEIFGFFDRNFEEGILQSWATSEDHQRGDSVLETSNRYMLPKRDAEVDNCIPFGEGIDPNGILEKMAASSDHVHTNDNEVLYFERRKNTEGKTIHDKIGPQAFRIGDLVEVQLSFVVVPLKGKQRKMITVLRSIALIDGSFRRVATVAAKVTQASSALKRKIRYEDYEERLSKKGMDVDGEDEG